MTGSRARLLAASLMFLAVFCAHGWYTMYGAADEAASRWVALETPGFGEKLGGYYSGGGLWMGYSYALAAGFALWSALVWHARRAGGVRAAGGFTLSGVIAGGACFMTGCCGSPMLGVWVSLLGASAAPWLGPFAALVSTASLLYAAKLVSGTSEEKCESGNCNC